jgi:murein L,D-transpeptidase YafK
LFATRKDPWCSLVVPMLLLLLTAAGAARAEYDDILYPAARYGPEKPLSQIVEGAGLVLDADQHLVGPRLVIEKSTYQLRLFAGDSLLKVYRIQLGKNAHGPKPRRYDGRTPVGSYVICTHNKWSRYYLSMQIDYPNEADIARAVKEKRITQGQAEGLRAARLEGKCPGGRTRLGGEVFIHGQLPRITREVRRTKRKYPPSRPDLQPGDLDPGRMKDFYNWTLGCIALTNPDIRELYKYLPDGTPVEIRE